MPDNTSRPKSLLRNLAHRLEARIVVPDFHAGAYGELHADEAILPAIEADLAAASQEILFECYLVASDTTGRRFVDLLIHKAKEGVGVWMVVDAVGSARLRKPERRALRKAGVHLHIYNPLKVFKLRTWLRSHRRIVVVDRKIGWVGGFGLSDRWENQPDAPCWRDLGLRLQGGVVEELALAFVRGRRSFPRAEEAPAASQANYPYAVLNSSRWLRQSMQSRLREWVAKTSQRMWITTGYFVPGVLVRKSLVEAASRGVDVRLYLPGRATDHPPVWWAARSNYYSLLKAKVRVFESHQRMIHGKGALLDDSKVIIGSSNLDHWSLHYNRELNVALCQPSVVADLEAAFARIHATSEEITMEVWRQRPYWKRALEVGASLFEKVL